MSTTRIAAATLLCAVSSAVGAAASALVPEPETLSLIAIGAIALIIAKTRRKK